MSVNTYRPLLPQLVYRVPFRFSRRAILLSYVAGILQSHIMQHAGHESGLTCHHALQSLMDQAMSCVNNGHHLN